MRSLKDLADKQKRYYEHIPTQIYDDARDGSMAVVDEIEGLIRGRQKENKPVVLGLATGSTPTQVYDELVRRHKEEGLSFKNVITFNLDEYYPMQPEALQSYVRFMHEYLFDHIDIPANQIHIPDGTLPESEVADFCTKYEEEIEKAGGLDLQILGIGRSGHIGFNEPGSHADSPTRMITLDKITRIDAASDFFSEEFVPRRAITMGVGTIMKARRVILMAWGEAKAPVVAKAVEGEISDTVPSSFLQKHSDTVVVLDEASAAELTRTKTPWLVGMCDWTPELRKRAVVWLCKKVDKPILKLTDEDYNENGMGDLLTLQGPAYNINIAMFNELQHTITGWPGGKPKADDTNRPERQNPFPKRVIIFSPHPDDDVISMGGTLIRLVDHGHEVHVAYQTSGNIAVFDDDVMRFVDFVSDYSVSFNQDKQKTKDLLEDVRTFMTKKSPGQVDSHEVQKLKALIRRGEAKSAGRYCGIPENRLHFLDMPFYETGRVRKKPIGKKDIDIIVSLLREVKPHQIYAAGDLSDPHGTHRVCLKAIMEALKICSKDDWYKDCYVWLYRGAWQEWEIHQIEMAVPLSPQELQRKRRAVFKHQSQKDRPLFPGHDEREFWQRAEARNHETAKGYDNLGFAEYEAMEAFVRYRGD